MPGILSELQVHSQSEDSVNCGSSNGDMDEDEVVCGFDRDDLPSGENHDSRCCSEQQVADDFQIPIAGNPRIFVYAIS